MANNISYEEIISIQRKTNIVDIIRDYVPLTQKGKNYFGICPFHDDHNPSMSVSMDKQMYKCFVCGNSGNVFNFVMEYEKISFIEAVKIVADKIGITLDIKTPNKVKIDNVNNRLYEIYDIATKFYMNSLNTAYGKDAKKYLNNRQIDETIIKEFNIGLSLSETELYNVLKSKKYTDEEIITSGLGVKSGNKIYDLYKNRIMFPLYDLEGKVVGFSGRRYDGIKEYKYINTKETVIFKKGELLYNYHIAKKEARKEKSIIVVEGFMDVIRLSSIGIRNVVATMGTAITKNHVSLIEKMAPNIILMFDGDEAGNKATLSYLENYGFSEDRIKIVRLPDGLDPDEYILSNGKEKMVYNITHTTSAYEYKLNQLKSNIDFTNSKDVSKYINLVLPEIQKIDDDIVRDLEINKLSKTTGVDKQVILSKININKEKKVIVKEKKITNAANKYEKASKYILYRMMHDNDIILYYYNNLYYLPFDNLKQLANEIVLFYKKYNSFNVNDFIIYLEDKKELINLIVEIDDLDYTNDELSDNIDEYFDTIRDYLYKQKIEKLTNDLKNETNELKRKEIAQKIIDIKIKESIKNE